MSGERRSEEEDSLRMTEYMAGATAGDVGAMYLLGLSYLHGIGGVPRAEGLALEWLSQAAAHGHRDAVNMMGVMYEQGNGTPVNLVQALDYYKQSNDTESIARVKDSIVDAYCRDAAPGEDHRPSKKARVEVSSAGAGEQETAARQAAAAKQAEILAKRRAESIYVPTRNAVAAAWVPTKVKLWDCPVHARPLTPGRSVLLEKCLHTICCDCAPPMIQPDNTVQCPICKVDSPVKLDALVPHPFIEAELAAGEAHDCVICVALPDDERIRATLKCTSCAPEKLLCEGHAVVHRMKPKTAAHSVRPLPDGGAALRCPTHDKPVEVYCTGCRQLICLACTLSTHQSHAARLLTDTTFVEAVRTRLVEGVAMARAVAEALIDHAADATVAMTEVDARDAATHTEIDRAVNVLVSLLERRRAAMHEDCDVWSREERAALTQAREESEHRWRIVASAADLAEQLATGTQLGVNGTAVMVQLEEAATSRLNAVLEFQPERGVPAPAVLRFHFDESLAEHLEGLGEIVQDAP